MSTSKNFRNKYLFHRILHFIKGILFSIYYSYIYTKRKKTIIFNSACNQEFTWNAKSLFLHSRSKLEALGFKVYFVINDKNKREYLTSLYGNYFICNKKKTNVIKIYTASIWILSTLETPCSGIFLNRKRFVYHLGHGTPIKNIGLCENNLGFLKKSFYKINKSNISLFLSSSRFFKKYMARAFGVNEEKIVVAPQPRIEDLINKNKNINFSFQKDKKYILYAPTWRHYDDVKLFPYIKDNIDNLNRELQQLNIIILLRLHPRFESNLNTYLRTNILNFNSKICEDISDALYFTSGLITDYSSIYCDYLLLKKPVALLPYDLDKYVKEIGFSFLYKEIFPKTIIKNHTDFIDFCAQVSNDCFNIEEQNTLAEKLNFIPDNCSITDYNISIIMKEYEKRWPSK
ncbi:CDP-glycerol glycerophosphotransferase family protein [Proteus mirabilis]|uniref:CDP-glycerol glycerophosphotransferase family protein n=1 Tax=Proteus mirabilis TaxID=584 RepID=UPI0019D2D254|nr:CDP-glycerol glycerophosphotransferase family protein [Proteus mirabilis]MBN7189804.1 hypothetical protein [Proteus mirabilis]MBN7243863.1 hypothetical protein [Proteus mirabilis]